MSLFKNGLEKASAEVTKLLKARVDLDTRHGDAVREMAELKERMPELALQAVLQETVGSAAPLPDDSSLGVFEGMKRLGRDAVMASNRCMVLDYEIKACLDAQRALIPRLKAAMKAVNVARAEEKRKQAARVQKSLDEHSAKVLPLKSQLELLEECAFAPEVRQVASDSGERGFQYAVSLSARLANQIAALHAEADAIENRKIGGGGASAETLEDLLQAVNTDPDTIPPMPSAIRTWFAAAFKEAEADFRRADYGSDFPSMASFPVEQSISLSWDEDGLILPGSTVRLRMAPISRQVATETFGAQYPSAIAAD